jgi:hypothetical protein
MILGSQEAIFQLACRSIAIEQKHATRRQLLICFLTLQGIAIHAGLYVNGPQESTT